MVPTFGAYLWCLPLVPTYGTYLHMVSTFGTYLPTYLPMLPTYGTYFCCLILVLGIGEEIKTLVPHTNGSFDLLEKLQTV